MKNLPGLKFRRLALALLAFIPFFASAFDSGSTGADGAFNPIVNTTVQLPPSGIFNYTTVNIPTGVTVTYQRNTTNTPVVILASGNVTIAGTINVSGSAGLETGASGSGNIGDDGTPGKGGPGGFDGGRGGPSTLGSPGGAGVGPGGGASSVGITTGDCGTFVNGGGGGGFSLAGENSAAVCSGGAFVINAGGPLYGSSLLVPLIGGSGGGGGAGNSDFGGSGGGGGGGAILIVSSGTVSVTGGIFANGGIGGGVSGTLSGGSGGGGSGGAIRIVATTISGNGTLNAVGGGRAPVTGSGRGGQGSNGYVRLEADTNTRTAASIPVHTSGTPGAIFVAGLPTLTISSVAGVAAPASPTGTADVKTGVADITLPAATTNPVTVVFNTTNVPVGNIIKLTLSPQPGPATTYFSPALTGSTASATSSVQVSLPVGASAMLAQTTYTIVASLGDALRNYAGNERVERIALIATFGGDSKATLITVSGKEYDAPPEALRIVALGR